MNHYANQAKAYQEALQLGAVTLSEFYNWADQVILAEDEPAIGFIELSLAQSNSATLKHLNQLAHGYKEDIAYKMLFGLLHKGLLDGRCDYDAVAKRLYFWHAYESDINAYSELIYFWDALDLARCGTWGDMNEIKKEMTDFLAAHKI
jgi:hypothetical protein